MEATQQNVRANPVLDQQDQMIKQKLDRIENKIMVMSGKGGVGKSTVAVNLALGLSLENFYVGLLDVDLHGPNVPKMLGLERGELKRRSDGTVGPVFYSPNLQFMSVEPLLPEKDSAVMWRGPLKMSAIRQFIYDIEWGDLDYLVIDAPPGTGDEPMTIAQMIPDAFAVVVTTPQEVSLLDVRKSISFCRHVNMPILGIVENMSGMICPHCGKAVDVFKKGGGEKLAEELGITFLGRIPVDPRIVTTGDAGRPLVAAYPNSHTSEAFEQIIRNTINATQALRAEKKARQASGRQ
ncbi:MAG: P-loop NTPase [Dissulfurimicrobium sp.]|uniref:Mrp/NBP35 family ATP-binding protein n=1 Tax=Dissulfurimicrobium TaxID=1769732 RepID=UPI001EDB206B|nr:Mrp/NBP35 family ATP-binding protein [Dissulfurimicrobium hydrothermale]UKL13013.1 Mrp/NBP35 family ATP-binding protein [Dissulfurimicrobium hydrothermale]